MNSTSTNCGCIGAATDILGDKWNPRIIHALSQHHDRFCALQRAVGGVNPRTLTDRLEYLEQCDIVRKEYDDTPHKTRYTLTAKGQALLPILQQMADWSSRFAKQAQEK